MTPPENTAPSTVRPSDNDLLWIHQDVGNPGASSQKQKQKQTIFSHVQSNHQAQKRRVEAKALRASALKGRTSALKDPSLQRVPDKEVRVDPQPALEIRSQQASRPGGRNQTSRTSDEAQDRIIRANSPLSPVGKGNSDPFHVYSIHIGPEENKLLGLYRDYIIPSVYHLGVKHKPLSDKNYKELAVRDWQDTVRGLEDEGTALGTLARYGSIASRSNPGMRKIALDFLGQSTRVLREKVFHSADLDTFAICMHINMLFNAEIINENLVGAVAHGKVLLHVFKQQWKDGRLDYKMLMYQLHNDMQLTSTFLIRPIFDEGDWLPTVLKPIWDAAAPYFPALPEEAEEPLDPAIENEVILHWFKQRRKIVRYESMRAANKPVPPLPLVTTSFLTSAFLFHSRMIGHYLDTAEDLKVDGLTDEVKCDLYARQFLALAGARLRKWSGYSPSTMGVLIYDDKHSVKAFSHALEQCELHSLRTNSDKYQKAQLWALYVGALGERGSVIQWRQTCQLWFNIRLAKLAQSMEIFTWTDLKEVLQYFLYEDSMMSQGSKWFEELMLDYRQ